MEFFHLIRFRTEGEGAVDFAQKNEPESDLTERSASTQSQASERLSLIRKKINNRQAELQLPFLKFYFLGFFF